ncbi:tetratricopeptide repeat protein [Aquimarina sp. 2201CG5-10]|uniref:tetratricopeptide repeat protein n=1 Tax=Aquimarina callyspongiae TaxID=3098150 RepID=UPI002AB42209|nr:tetratricopeptide repeat protein [Aquimarina sp. 2201CG5-10]MDY8138765.1 tetratricopeptide repeat protein [Aquimarina sp. 2201CG5-10]
MKQFLIIIVCFQFGIAFSQDNDLEREIAEAKQYVATGNEVLVEEGNFPKAEGEYRKAIAKNPADATAKYNLGNAYYGSEKYDEAVGRYTETAKVASTKTEKHKAFHNQGNTYMEQKKYKEAVDAYKNALRNNPKDDETRYNLALAKKMLEQEQQQNDQNKDQDKDNKDQNKDQNKDNKDQEGDNKEDKKDEGKEDKDKKDDQKDEGDQGKDKNEDQGDKDKDEKGEPKDDEKDKGKDQKDGEGKPEEQQQQPQQVQGQLSPQQVKSLLEAMNNEEKKVQDKINAKKAKGAKTRTEKDW